MSSGDDDGATPAKLHKPNEPIPIFVVGEEEVIENNEEEVQEIVQDPAAVAVEAQTAFQSVAEREIHEAVKVIAEDEQYHTDDSQSIVSDDGHRDVQNVKEILIVSEIDSDDDDGEGESETGDSDDEYEPYGDHDSQIDVDKMKTVLIVSELDSDDDSFCDGGSENSDDNDGLPPEWQMNCQPGAAPIYYHIPSGAVTNVRPRVHGTKVKLQILQFLLHLLQILTFAANLMSEIHLHAFDRY
ncbi:histone chaperone ASF1-like isoform X1 [Colias croceus]|uniref:histone chaperone ASF1-like isoform X1 n=1 Tax=Colias crocea TaxID=72248 RepID=UPI001E27D250|nr:histone chaperone ASF1-like isoform X1 [Colias croceus]